MLMAGGHLPSNLGIQCPLTGTLTELVQPATSRRLNGFPIAVIAANATFLDNLRSNLIRVIYEAYIFGFSGSVLKLFSG
jgi:hypothetical protein